MNKKKDLSQEDKETWEKYVNDPSDIYDKDKNIQTKHVKKNRFRFDLHGFSLEDANTKVKDIILSCFENNYKEILLITGKGTHSSNDKNVYTSQDLGKLRFSVPEFLRSNQELNDLIISIEEAPTKEGGKGAIVVKLKSL